MTKTTLKLLSGFCLIALLFTSCAKDGAVGPAGPQGPAGSVDIVNSGWLNLYFSGSSPYHYTISVPKLTQTIIDSGEVHLYFNNYGNVYEAPSPLLPNLSVSFAVGEIDIYSQYLYDASAGYQYRYVLTPPH